MLEIDANLSQFNFPDKVYYNLESIPKPHGPIIATHNGRFHGDDIAAVALLLQLKGNENAQIIRTRDTDIINKANFVVDVGLVYDPEKNRFDHHQPSFNLSYNSQYKDVTRMSSAGLVFKHYGDEILRDVFHIAENDIPIVKEELYKVFFAAVDAIDNGVGIYTKHFVDYSSYSSRIHRINNIGSLYDDESMSIKFIEGLKVAVTHFKDIVNDINLTVIGTIKALEEAFTQRFSVHKSGKVIYLDEFLGLEHLYKLEETMEEIDEYKHMPPGILYVIYRYDESSYRIRAVPTAQTKFINRLPFPKIIINNFKNYEGITFIHRDGFIGGAKLIKDCINLIDATFNYYTSMRDVQ